MTYHFNFSEAFDCEVGVGVLKIGRGLDFSEQMLEHQIGDTRKLSMMVAPNTNILSNGSVVNQIPFINVTSPESTLSIVQEEPNDYSSIHQQDFASPPLTPSLESHTPETQMSAIDDELDRDFNRLENSTNTRNSDSVSTSSSSTISLEPVLTIAERVMESLPNDKKLMHSSPSNPYSRRLSTSLNYNIRRMSKVQREILAQINQFQGKVKSPLVHVYWLADDGGKCDFGQ